MDELKWHLDRQKGIGGSDASTVLGINPWKSRLQLYHEKVDEITADKIDNDNIRFKLGHVLEPMIAEEYYIKTGREIFSRPQKIHPLYPFMVGNIDREIAKSENNLPGILEIKTKGAFINWDEDIPPYYHSQIQHYMAVYDYTWGSFAVLDFNKFEITITDVERDDKFIENLIMEEAKFWDLVENRTPPKVEPTTACEDFLREYFNKSEPITINLESNNEATKYAEKLNHIKTHKKELEEAEIECKTFFMNLMETAEKATGDGYTITWKNDRVSEKFNVDKFKQDNPSLYSKYLEPKKGSRRFLAKFDKEMT